MITPSVDPVEYKTKQLRMWNSVAVGWGKWWPTFEKGAQIISHRMVELAAISPGKQVLDIATGIGEPAVTAARMTGPEGLVIATDLSTEMLAIGRKRAAELRIKNIEFRRMDAEAVDQMEHLFDAILCRWGLFFLPDLKKALEKMRQRLVPGGRFVAAVWDEPQKVPALSLPMKVADEILKRRPPSGPGVFSLSDEAVLREIFMDAGFVKVHTEELVIVAEFASASEFTQFTKDISAPVKMLMSDQTPKKQSEIWDAITNAAGLFAGPDGRIEMPMTSIIVRASQKNHKAMSSKRTFDFRR